MLGKNLQCPLLLSLLLISYVLAASKEYFTTTAVISNTSLPASPAAFQCWRRPVPFTPYPTIGSFVQLANLTNATLVALPRAGREGLHKPPHPMLFVQLQGTARVTLPADPTNPGLSIDAGQVIVAVDTEGEGHWTRYGDEVEALALQLFLEERWRHDWEVVHDGVCEEQRFRETRNGGAQVVLGG